MYLDGFSLLVQPGVENNGYVELEHGQQYSIILSNSLIKRCDVELKIDGKDIDTFRLERYGSITLERPTNDNGRFTFYKSGSKEAKQSLLDGINKFDLGLISATFIPEIEVKAELPKVEYDYGTPWVFPPSWFFPTEPNRYTLAYNNNFSRDYKLGSTSVQYNCNESPSLSFSGESRSGGTGLSGVSHQQFIDAGEINRDYNRALTIHIRLIEVSKPALTRPLISKSTKIPVPV